MGRYIIAVQRDGSRFHYEWWVYIGWLNKVITDPDLVRGIRYAVQILLR